MMEVWRRLSLGGVTEDTPGLMTDKKDVSTLSLGERPLRVGVACLQFKACSVSTNHVPRNMNGFLFAPCRPRLRSPECFCQEIPAG